MLRLERLLSTNLAILAVIGAVMLGLGQQDVKLPLLVFIGALTSVVYTDRRKVFSLNHHIANLAALGAVGLALIDFSASDRNQQLLAIANLLVYLQVVVFFQEKNARIFGQLAMLSLLQVVVAAALNYSIFFGVLILAYMGIGLPTLSLFFFYRELSRFVVVNETNEGKSIGVEPAAPAWMEQQSSRPNRKQRRWPLSRQEAIFSGADFQKQEEAFGKGGLLAFTTRMSLFTFLLTLIVFIFAPRFGKTPWQATALEPTRIVGYSEEVTLGKTGNSTENPETVMRVGFVDEETERRLHLSGSPLFRGTILTDYNLQNRRWSQRRGGAGSGVVDLPGVRSGMRDLVRQEITLEPSYDTTAFAVFPAYAMNPNSSIIKYDENRRQLFRTHSDQQSKFNLWTTGIEGARQKDIIPAGSGIEQFEIRHLQRIPRGEAESEPFAGLRRVADEAVADSGVDPENAYEVAIALERFLLSQGGFKYSLEGQEPPEGKVDPIEDFVTRTRVGHCEYFASALTLMLRHRGIPARMVVGFKGGDWNPIGEYYQVRQLHAHAWVEAFFKRSELEANGITLGRNNFAAWVTLDPTADTLAAQQLQGESWWSQAKTVSDYIEMQWITYVIGFSQEQQQEHIYNPLKDALSEVTKNEQAANPNQSQVPWYSKVVNYVLSFLAGSAWFSWRGFLVSSVILSIIGTMFWGAGRAGKPLLKKLKVWWLSSQAASQSAKNAEVVFYHQMESLLKKHGYQRQPGQTQLEFANRTGLALADLERASTVSPLPREVTNAFYAVRFGGKSLNPQQSEKVEQALAALQTALTKKPGHNGHAKKSTSNGSSHAMGGHSSHTGNGKN